MSSLPGDATRRASSARGWRFAQTSPSCATSKRPLLPLLSPGSKSRRSDALPDTPIFGIIGRLYTNIHHTTLTTLCISAFGCAAGSHNGAALAITG